MTDYTKLAKALREQSGPKCTDPICSKECDQYKECGTRIIQDAADAIEEMAKHITEMHEHVTVLQIDRGQLEAEVKRLKECNDELREKQTFIDHWGTRWGTSAEDVPDSAYKHGYADGKYEALTLEECIDRLHELGWLQEHDRILSQPHWVSVEDRKPEPNTDIVFIAKYGDTYEIDIGSMSKARKWWGYDSFHRDENVIYWMPLPEPPKEDE